MEEAGNSDGMGDRVADRAMERFHRQVVVHLVPLTLMRARYDTDLLRMRAAIIITMFTRKQDR